MIGIAAWARDVLVSRGALVEDGDERSLRALLPPEVAAALGSPEWLLLNFGAGAGADDPVEWTERLGALLPAEGCVVGARLRAAPAAPRVDTEAIITRELVIQNGICRIAEDYPVTASYLAYSFQYTVESDERGLGLVTVCLNTTADAVSPRPNFLVNFVRDGLEDDPGFRIPADRLAAAFPAAAALARAEVRKRIAPAEEASNRRLARDTERVTSYYRDLIAQIGKRIARCAGDADACQKERSRLEATELDRAAKLEDLVRKYSLRVQIELTGVLALTMPVREISVRLMRKKEERPRKLHWNCIYRALDIPMCEKCFGPARPLYLCEKVHCLCGECWRPCPRCGRFFCPVCQARCKCERQG